LPLTWCIGIISKQYVGIISKQFKSTAKQNKSRE
jgi:hypothetical protein